MIQAAVDTLRKLDQRFVHAYEVLHDLALTSGSRSPGPMRASGRAQGEWRTNTGQVHQQGGVEPGKRYSDSTRSPLGEAAALVYKQKIDKRIRRVRRDIEIFLRGEIPIRNIRRCTRGASTAPDGSRVPACGLFADEADSYCSRCGAPTREVDLTE